MKPLSSVDFRVLKLELEGEFLTDHITRSIYATDASIYQIAPSAVAIPKTEEDVIKIVKFCSQHYIPILARGSATSLAGQTVSSGVVIDFTRYFDKITAFDPENRLITVQPGVTRDQINKTAKSSKLHFAPDPATSARATVGGMIANNSSGTRSLKYGKTIDHIHSLKILLATGEIIRLEEVDVENYDFEDDSTLSKILKNLRKIVFENSAEIKEKYPKTLRRVSGYPLDEFVDSTRWNLAKIFAGSEGTLGIILEATLKLEPIPDDRVCAVLHYNDRLESISSVKQIVEFEPASVEMLDYNVLSPAKVNPITATYYRNTITGVPQSIMIVEFFGNEKFSALEQASKLKQALSEYPSLYEVSIFDKESDLDQLSALRKEGLGLIMGEPGGRKPMPFIEDAAIPLDNLTKYIEDILKLCDDFGLETILYAHASVGVLHVRPSLNLRDPRDIEIMQKISEESFQLVKKYRGSFSSEHGDGRVRSYQIQNFYGDKIYECFKTLKKSFDPQGIMNPGVIIDAEPMTYHLRYGANYSEKKYNFEYYYHSDHSFEEIVHNCSGIGACRNLDGGVMCPSFRATRNEADSTRGRANILRLAMSGQMNISELVGDEVLSVLDLCLSCKACKSECPSKVDMAKLKSEVLQIKYDRRGASLRDRLVLYNEKLSHLFAGRWSFLYNNLLRNQMTRWVMHRTLGIHQRRRLPALTSVAYKKVIQPKTPNGAKTLGKVALFVDCYVKYHEPHIGAAALKLLEKIGFEVMLIDGVCCQRPLISKGFLKKVKSTTGQIIEAFRQVMEENIPILTLEPSCNSALIDDIPDLIKDKATSEKLKKSIEPLDQFLVSLHTNGIAKFKSKTNNPIIYHSHCHHRTLYRTRYGMELLKLAGFELQATEAGCCGMAGLFGYEKEHYDISIKIASDNLVPAILDHPAHTIVAEGFSCRHQIADCTAKCAIHWVELLDL